MVNVSHALQILITAKDQTGKGVDSAGTKVKGLVGTIAKAGAKILAIFATLVMAIPTLISGLVSIPLALATGLAKLTEYAAELDLVRRAFLGISGEGAPAMLRALKESSAFMIEEIDLLETYNKAYTLLGKNLADRLPDMMKYLTKVAAATGDDVTRLAELTIRSVGRMSTRWMAYVGVVVTVEEAELRAAEMFGVLTEELTRQQKQAGLLELTLERLEARTSNMPEVMGTAAQMVAAFRVESKELYGDLTTFLLPVTRALFPVVMKIVTGFRQLISESGALYRPIRTITATLVVLTEMFGGLVDSVVEFTTKGGAAIEGFADKIISMAWKAFSWGANLIVNFASGMIKGASQALIAAMNFIGGLLAHWLAPGSPPLIASNIDEWGAGTFTEWLKGFAMADFDVLEGLQAPLKRALDIFVGLGRMAPLEAFYIFQGLTEDLTAAIVEFNQTGVISTGILERLAEVGGGYGESLAELFRRYAGLAAATRAYAEAQERLKRATEAEDSATKRLSKEAREYNKLVRAGADPAILRGKLAGVKAAHASLVAARLEKKEAEDAEERAKEQLRLQREQVRLQERLLNQLISMAEALLAAQQGTDDIAELPELEWPEVNPLPIDQAFEDLKERIRAKFEELWAELSKTWEDSEAGKWVTRLQERWETFKTDTLGPLMDEFEKAKGKVMEWAQEVAVPWLIGKWEELRDFWVVEGPKWTKYVTDEWDKWVKWWEDEGPEFERLIGKVSTAWEDAGLPNQFQIWAWVMETIRIYFAWIMESIRKWITIIVALLNGDWALAWQTFKDIIGDSWNLLNDLSRGKLGELVVWIGEQWELLKAGAVEKWEEIKVAIVEKLTEIGQSVIDKWEEVKLGVEEKWEALKLAAEEKWEEIKETIKEKVEDLFDWMGLDMDEMLGKWEKIWEDVKLIAEEIWTRIKDYVSEKVEEVRVGLVKKLDKIKAWWDYKWTEIRLKVETIWTLIKTYVITKVTEIYEKVKFWIRILKAWWGIQWEAIKQKAIDLFGETYEAVKRKVQAIYYAVTDKINEIKTWISNKWSEFWNLGYNLIKGIGDGIGAMAGWLINKATSLVQDILNRMKAILGIPGSASAVGEDMGSALIQGMADGMGKVAALPAIAMDKIVVGLSKDITVGGIDPSFARGSGGDGRGAASIVIHNHFGKDSVRSSKDIYDMTKQMRRSLTLRGARTVV